MKKKYLITSALPYINGIKHLGNLVGSMLPADVYARFLRQEGHDVLYICGTDEHGTPSEIAAENANMEIQKYCDLMYEKQKENYKQYNLSFDFFGRTSSDTNHKLTQKFYEEIKKNGFIEEKKTKQFYSKEDHRFLPDRYVNGECPFCGYKKARGDQCDSCSKLLEPQDLLNPYSAISKSKDLELKETTHMFLNLEKIQNDLKEWIDQKTEWPDLTKSIAYKWIKEGLKSRSITRDLKWGVKVPDHDDKVFYVWFDAPIGYISITKDYLNEDYKKWWQDPEVQYVQFMAKDNVAFHAIFFPAMILASKMNFKLVDIIKSVNWLNFEGDKFSTSQERGIFMDKALEIAPSDYWRYYLMANIPENSDSNFTMKHFCEVINKDLVNVLGNLINRVFVLSHKYCNSKLKYEEFVDPDFEKLKESFKKNMYALKMRLAMQDLREMWVFGNVYITKNEPWFILKSDLKLGEKYLSNCIKMIYEFSKIMQCVMPEISEKILSLINKKDEYWYLKKANPLFEKIEYI